MGHGLVTVYSGTVASGATLSSEIKLKRNFEKVYLEITSIVSNSQHWIQAAEKEGGTFVRICHPVVNTSTIAANNDFVIHSSVTNRLLPLPNGFVSYKIERSATADDGQAYVIVTADGG